MSQFCKDNRHGKSIVKRWYDKDQDAWFAIMRCRKCDVWARVQIGDACNAGVKPTLERVMIEEFKR